MKIKSMIIAQPCSKNVDQLLDIIKKIKCLKTFFLLFCDIYYKQCGFD